MKRWIGALAIGLVFFSIQSAYALRLSPLTSRQFGAMCTRKQAVVICDAYIAGMSDAAALSFLNAKSQHDTSAVAGFCVPADASMTSIRAQVVAWMQSHRNLLNEPVGKTVFSALHSAYPCAPGAGPV